MSPSDLLLRGVEREILTLALLISSIYQHTCSIETAKCLEKSYDECIGVSYGQVCIQNYPKEDMCYFKGRLVPAQIGTRFPINFDMDSLTNQQKLFICSIHKLKYEFLRIKQQYTNQISRVYLGTNFGFYAGFPAIIQGVNGKCKDSYDPSERLWYLQATAGPKNIVFVIDLSKAMARELQKVKEAVKNIIKTLTLNDFVGVVLMRNTSKILIYNQLNRATPPVKQALSNSISTIEADETITSVNYELAFEEVKKLFTRIAADSFGVNCQFSSNVVVFMTASRPTEGAQTSDALISQIDQWNEVYKIKFFAYSLKDNEDFSILKNLSCRYEGNFYDETNRTSSQSLSTDLRAYQRFLSGAVNIDIPLWSQSYNDHWTGQRMVTVSFPLYKYVEEHREKFGVVAIDIKMDVLNVSDDEAFKLLVRCPTKSPKADNCVLEKIRSKQAENSTCKVPGCSLQDKHKCSYLVNDSIMRPSELHRANASEGCCFGSISSNIIGLISMVPCLVFGCIFFCIQRYRFKNSYQLKSKQYSTIPQSSNDSVLDNLGQRAPQAGIQNRQIERIRSHERMSSGYQRIN